MQTKSATTRSKLVDSPMMTTNAQRVASNDGALLLTFDELLEMKAIDDDAPVVTRDTYARTLDHRIEWKNEPLESQYNKGDEPVIMRGAWWTMVRKHTCEDNWSGSFSSFSNDVAERFIRLHRMTLITKNEFEKAEQKILDLMIQGNRYKRSVYRRAKTPVELHPPKKYSEIAVVYVKGRKLVVSKERYLMMCSLHAKASRLKTLEEKINQIKERNNGKD